MVSVKDKGTSTEELSNDPETIYANAQKESETVKSDEMKEFNSIDVTTYLDYYAGEDTKLVLLARPTCHYCQIAEPILQNIMYEYNIDLLYQEGNGKPTSDAQCLLKDGV